jgi:hypothetical protein
MDTAAFALTATTAIGALVAAVASWRTAGETRRAWESAERADQLRLLESIHQLVGTATEVGWSVNATRYTRIAHSFGGPKGLWFTWGQELRGKVEAAHCELPLCRQVAEELTKGNMREAPIRQALDEVRREMELLKRPRERLGVAQRIRRGGFRGDTRDNPLLEAARASQTSVADKRAVPNSPELSDDRTS